MEIETIVQRYSGGDRDYSIAVVGGDRDYSIAVVGGDRDYSIAVEIETIV